MLEFALICFTAFFATIAPFDVAGVFIAVTPGQTESKQRAMAIRGVVIAGAVLLVFVFLGELILRVMGITVPALRIAGGIMLFLMALDMVFARASGGVTTTVAETAEAEHKNDISVFPLATPLIAGPGAMGTAILLTTQSSDLIERAVIVPASLLAVLLITLALLLTGVRLHKFVSLTAQNVVHRIMGVLLAALSVQFVLNGLKDSGIFS